MNANPLHTNRKRPVKLVFPKITQTFELPAGSLSYSDKPLEIRCVTDYDWQSLIINVITAGIIFLVIAYPISRQTHDPKFMIALPLAIIWVLVVCFHSRLWTTVKGRKSSVYLNNMTRELTVYSKGFHFIAWPSEEEDDEVDYQKHETLRAEKEKKTQIIFPSANGFDIELDLLSMFARRDSPEALARSLKYTLPELKDLIWANIKMNLTNLGGQNSYQSLLYYKADAIAWIANIFAGDGRLSLFEQQTGTTITSPLATNMGLTDETQKIFATGARIEVIVKGTDALVKAIGGGNPTPAARMEAARIAQAAEGAATRTIHTYEGIPEGATTVALGDSGIAIAAKGGK